MNSNSYLAPLVEADLKATGLQLENMQTREKINIRLSNNFEIPVEKSTESDEQIPSVAYLQLKYGLSKECYHELTMLSKELPRSSTAHSYLATL